MRIQIKQHEGWRAGLILQAIPHVARAGSIRINRPHFVGHTGQRYCHDDGLDVVVIPGNQPMIRLAYKAILPFFNPSSVKQGRVK